MPVSCAFGSRGDEEGGWVTMIHAHITTVAPFFSSGDRTRRKRRRRSLVIVVDPARGCTCKMEVNNKEYKINIIPEQKKGWRSTVKMAINIPKRCVINHGDDDMNGDEDEWLLREKRIVHNFWNHAKNWL